MALTVGDINKCQDALYRQLQLLNLMYPASKDFQTVCKNRMFAKSNKAAFHHVIHYLLNILYPDNIKNILPSWPIIEIRMEVPFRNEVFKAINELGNKYKTADIPPIMPSHFVSPGGPRFIKFMFKLSQLAITVSIERNTDLFESSILRRPQPIESKLCPGLDIIQQQKSYIDALKGINKLMDHECAEMKNKFDEDLKRYQDKEKEMLADEKRLKINLPRLKSKLTELQSCQHFTRLDEISIEIDNLQKEVEESNTIRELFDEGCKYMNYSTTEASLLKYRSDTFTIPQEVEHIIPSGIEKLNLIDLIAAFNKYLQIMRFKLKEVSSVEVAERLQKFDPLLQKLMDVSNRLDGLNKQFQNVSFNVNNNDDDIFKDCGIKVIVEDHSNNSTLAVPLEDTA